MPMPSPPQADDEKPRITSRDLLRGCRDVIIVHEKDEYRLRLTASNKLILVK
jgi:hemin uptake protein HemP